MVAPPATEKLRLDLAEPSPYCLNIHTGLSALWTWAVAEGIAGEHVVRKVSWPKTVIYIGFAIRSRSISCGTGGDAYSLQEMLGHTTLEMVKRYLEIAQVGMERAYRRALPLANRSL